MPKIAYKSVNFRSASLDIIHDANTIIVDYQAQGFDLTLRQLYYQFVSRDLFPDSWIDQTTGSKNSERSYKKLGDIINDARLAGMIDWDAISDRTRFLRSDSHWTSPASIIRSAAYGYNLDKWQGQEYRPEVWIEKDALVGVIQGICDRYDVPYISCRGYMSQSEMWATGQRFLSHIEYGQVPYIIHLGDHDPSGKDMTDDIWKRLELFTDGYEGDKFYVKRIALNYDQVEQYNPPPNPTKMALALDTLLPTPTGWTTMGEVKVGDMLFGKDGKSYPVIGKSDVFNNKSCLEFTFACGDKVVCSEDHLWEVSARKRKGGVMMAATIADSWLEGKENRKVYRVRVADAIDLPDADLPIPPYVLGTWLGDGNSDAEGFACALYDEEILDHIRSEGFDVARKPSFPVAATIYGLRGKLYSLGVANNKHIPTLYLRASYKQRLELLQGLMDTDGCAHKNRMMTPCFYASSRRNLAEQTLELLSTLGIRGRLLESRAIFNGKDYGPTWRVEFYPGDLDVFRLSRKRDILRGSTIKERQKWRTITNVRRVDPIPTQCLAIESPDHLFLCGRDFIPTHNTDSRANNYIAEFGMECWELDALEPTVIANLIEDEILSLRDLDKYEEVKNQEDAEKEELDQIRKRYREVVEFLNNGHEE